MKITAIETLTAPEHPFALWVRIHTNEGLVGLGESVASPGAIARVVHDRLAEIVLGQDPMRIEQLWHRMYRAIHYHGAGGAEMRGLSAVDTALWDLLGKVTNQPVYVLLGGASRDRIPIYNTCGDYGSIRDHEMFLTDPIRLARDLLDEGIPMMKIWPFDRYATATDGQYIAPRELEAGVDVVRQIRDAVGTEMEIAIEGHSLWNLPSAIRIARELEPYRPLWLEDMMWPDNIESIRQLRQATTIPITTSERLFGRFASRQVMERDAGDVVMPDLAWTGGFSEARKIAAMASVYQLPIAPHNCGGPVSHLVTAHFCAHIYNLFVMETVRAFYRGFFDDLLTVNLIPTDGALPLPPGPGLGTDLRPDLLSRQDLLREVSDQVPEQVPAHATGDPWTTQKF
jgi:L-alanine-DL-glutamate epimerase-like enolase superfamily enzyme